MFVREHATRRDSQLFREMCTLLLRLGHQVQFRAQGQSMHPNLRDGDDVVVVPADAQDLRRGEIALVQNQDGLCVHRVAANSFALAHLLTKSDTALENDLPADQVYGKVTRFSRNGRSIPVNDWRARIVHPLASFALRVTRAVRQRMRWFAPPSLVLFFALFLSASLPPIAFAQADLALTQSTAPPVVTPGADITSTESVINNGPNSATTAVLYQSTPPNTTFVSLVAPAGWTCATPEVGATGQVTCTDSAALSNSAQANFTYVVQVNAGTAAGTTIVNSANVTSQTTDGQPRNNATASTVLVESSTGADLALSMSASPSPVFVNATLTYTIQVTNLGLINANNVTVSDTIPSGTTFVSASTIGSCTQTASVVCTLGTLTNGSSTTVTIVVTASGTSGSLLNTATVSSTTSDPVASNNSATLITVAQPLACASPGRDGLGSSITGIVNTYFAPATSPTTLAAGTNTVTLGAATGATTPIGIGDLLLIIQMQGATINSTNTSSYGDGSPGDPATGWLSLGNSGLYEFVTASRNVPATGGLLTFTGTGPNNGALNTYTQSAFGTNGQKSFQVIRVPQYTSVSLGAALTAQNWNGSTGGILAIDVAAQFNLNSQTASVSGLGFRGGAGRSLGGGTGLSTDYVTFATDAMNGSKGEGIAGTPRYVANAAITNLTDTGVEGYPNGSYARGAPATAGGGATDPHPSANDQNAGGGGGGNGGSGGYGGYGWNSAGIEGGDYGAAYPASTNGFVLAAVRH